MVKRLLVIDGDDQGHFFVMVDGGTMTIGGSAADIILEDLHISRIHCEVEVDEDVVVVGKPESGGAPLRKELHAGEALQIGPSRLRLEGLEGTEAPALAPVFSDDEIPGFADAAPAAAPPAVTTPAAPAQATTLKKFVVIDGGDKGRFFSLPETGITTIGKSSKHADIALHDLYVSRVH